MEEKENKDMAAQEAETQNEADQRVQADQDTESETDNGTGTEEMVTDEQPQKEAQTEPEDKTPDAGSDKQIDPPLEEQTTEKRSFFGKKKKDKKDAQIEELTDRVRRQMAEFDNFRKRTEKEKSSMYDMGVRSTIEKILPVVDNFERGLSSAGEKEDAFVQGMQKIYKQLTDMLDSMDVKPIEAVGQPFDSNLHNAVMHVEDEEAGENMVVEEFQKGYMYHDVVIRHSMVKVAN